MEKLDYGYRTILRDLGFDAAVEMATAALAAQGFGVLTTIDVAATMKKKLDVDMRPYLILGACHPSSAHQALGADPHIGLLLPCNAVVRELDEGGIEISMIDPLKMFQVASAEGAEGVAEDVDRRVRGVIGGLG